MARILVFGGTFDPPHRGHLALLASAARRIRPDRVLIVPAYRAPWKQAASASAADRLAMARLLARRLPPAIAGRTRVDASEASSGRVVYTVETVERLARRHPGAELHVLVGSDSASRFLEWRRPTRLRALARWWTARRPGSRDRAPAFFQTLPGAMPPISSSELRLRLFCGGSAARELWPELARAIARRGLYGEELRRRLRCELSERRFAHSLAVARLAARLARRWAVRPQAAALAGLLHDCGRSIAVSRMPSYARRRALSVPALGQIARRNPLLLHAYVGADLARRRYGVRDAEVVSAIAKHTLGAPRMSPLDRILYVSDACSQDRRYPGASAIRAQALRDIDGALRRCLRGKLEDALGRGAWIHPVTVALWNSLQA